MSINASALLESDRVRRRLAWAVPLVVAGVVAGGVAISATSASGSTPTLTKRTPAQLIAAVEKSKTAALSGEVTETANLGIPSLPGARSSASLSWQTFVSGSHSARVWIDGADKQRVALVGELSEADVVHNGADVWTYTSESNTASHSTLPRGKHDADAATGPSAADLTPAAAATKLLDAVSPTTSVTVETSRTVAERAAYTLVLRPKQTGSTVGKATIAIDAKTFVPLQVQVFGSGSSPAFQTGFTSISYTRPSASTFQFHTPAEATISNNPFTPTDRHGDHSHGNKPTTLPKTSSAPDNAEPTVIGKGWTSVLELPKGVQTGVDNGNLRDLTSAVGSSGQRLLHTALINALILPDGRTFVGAVTPSVLQRVAASTPR